MQEEESIQSPRYFLWLRPFSISLGICAGIFLFSLAGVHGAEAATVTWDNSSGDGLWSTAANWSGDELPRIGDEVIFDGTSNTASNVDTAFAGSVGKITMNTGYTNTVTLRRGLSVVNTGGRRGTLSVNSGTFSANGNTNTVAGVVKINGGTYLAGSATQTFSDGLEVVAGVFTGGSGTIAITGSIIFQGGTINGGTASFTVTLGYIKSAGTLNPGTSTFTFTGTAAAIDVPASETFFNLTFAPGNTVIKHIAPGDTLISSGTLTLTDGNINAGIVEARGDIAQASTFDGGTGSLVVGGASSQVFTGSATMAAGSLPPFQINKTGGTLTLAGTIRTANNWKYTAGTIDAGTSLVVFAGTSFLQGNHTLNDVTFNSATTTITKDTTVTVSGLLNLTAGAINTGTVAAKGNILQTSTSGLGTGTIVINGTGAQTFTGSATTAAGDLPNIEINRSSATLTLAGTIRSTTGNWKYTTGTIDPTGSLLVKAGGYIFGSHTLNALDIRGATRILKNTNITLNDSFTHTSSALTLNGALIVMGDTTLTAGTIDGFGQAEARGNITQASGYGGGAARLIINGTGAQTFTGSSTVAAGILPDLVINKVSGTLTLSGTIRTTNDWIYTSGTVAAAGSTVVFGASLIVDGSHTLDSVTFNAGTITIDGDTALTATGLTTLTAGSINTGTLNVQGDLTQASAYTGGTGTIKVNGTGTQTFTGSATTAAGGLPNFEINKTSGTLNLAGTIRTANAWIYTSGTIAPGTSLLVMAGGRIQGTHTLNALDIRVATLLAGDTTLTLNSTYTNTAGAFTVDGTLVVLGNVSLTGGSIAGIGQVQARADVTQESGSAVGAGFLVFNGTGNQLFTGNATTTTGQLPNVRINKSSGTLTLSGTIRTGSFWAYFSGNVDATTNDSTVVFGGANLTLNGEGDNDAVMAFDNVIFQANTTTLAGALDVNGNLTVAGGTLNTSTTNYPITVAGDWSNTSGTFTANSSTVTFDGTGTQTVNSGGVAAAQQFFNVITDKVSGSVVLSTNALFVNGDFYIKNGTFDVGAGNLGVTVLGSWKNAATFTKQSGTVTLQGTQSASLEPGVSSFNNLTINKTSATAGLDDIYLIGANNLTVSGNLTISDGEFIQKTLDVTVGGTTTLTVASSTWTNRSTGDITLGGTVSNAGIITWNGNDGAAGDADDILLRSTIATTQRTISGAGTFVFTDLDIQDMNASVAITANSSTNTSNNTGITFAVGTGYKVWDGGGVDNNWSTLANWSGDTLPVAGDSVLFDGTSSKDVTMNNVLATVSGFFMRGYTGTITQTNTVTVTNNFEQTSGTFTGGATTVTISGNFIQTGGTFTAPSGTFNIAGGMSYTGGTFTPGSNTVTLTGSGAYLDASGIAFNNLTIAPGTAGSHKLFADNNTTIVNGTLTLTEGFMDQAIVPVGGTIAARGGITQVTTFDGGDGTLMIDGTASPTFTGGGSTAAGTLPKTVINKTGGTLTLSSTIRSATNDWIYTAGTVDAGTSTMVFAGGRIVGSQTFNALTVNGATTVKPSTVLTVSGVFTMPSAIAFLVNGQVIVTGTTTLTDGSISGRGTVNFRGDISQASTFDGASGTSAVQLVIDGTGAQAFSGTASTAAGDLPVVNINKASGTLTFSGTLRTTNTWIYTTGTVDPGTSTIVFAGSQNIRGTHTLRNVTFNGAALHVTIVPTTTLTTTGTLTLTDGFLDVGTLNAQGDISQAATYDGGNGTIVINGSATQAFGGAANTTTTSLPNININKTGGTLTLSGTIRTSAMEWMYTAGTMDAGTSIFECGGATIIGSQTLATVNVRTTTIVAVGTTLTVSTALNMLTAISFIVNGTVIDNGNFGATDGTIDGIGTFEARGDITQSTLFDGGAGQLLIDGAGAQLFTGSGSTTLGTMPVITIDKASGTLSLASTIRTANTWLYNAGTISAGTSNVVFAGALTIIGNESLNDVTFNGAGVSYSLSPVSTLTVLGVLTLTDGLIDVGSINVRGDIAQASTFDGGTGQLLINGTGAQGFSGTATTGAGLLPIITINKGSGTLTLSGTLRTANNWNYTTGTLDPGTSTIVFAGGAINGSHTLNAIDVRAATAVTTDTILTLNSTLTMVAAISFIVNGTVIVNGTFVATDGTIDGLGMLKARGDITQGSLFDGGTGNLLIDGTGAQLLTGGGSTSAGLLPILTLNKASGSLSLASTIRTANHFIYTAGTMSPGTSEMVFAGSLSLASSPTFNNVTFNGVNANYFLSPTGVVTVLGTLTLTDGSINQGNVGVQGDITQASTFDGGTGIVLINGTGTQTFTGSATTAAGSLPDITINKVSGTLNLAGTIRTVAGGIGALDYIAGTLNAGTSSFIFSGANTVTGDPTLNHVELQGNNSDFIIDDDSVLTVNGTLTLTDGNINGGTIDAKDGIIHSSLFDGGTGTLLISGAATRSITMIGAGQMPSVRLNAVNVTLNGPVLGVTTFDGDLTVQAGLLAIGVGDLTLNGVFLQTGGTITGGAGTTTSAGYFRISGGTFTGAGGTMDHNGPFSIVGGSYTAPSGSLLLGSTFIFDGGSFAHNSGTVVFDTASHTDFAATNPTFNNLIFAGPAASIQTINSLATFIVTGNLTLTDGNINTGTVEAQNTITHTAAFDGGTGFIAITGPTTRTINLVAAGQMPGVTLNSANTTIAGAASGTVTFDQTFKLIVGTFTGAAGNNTFSGEFIQDGGSFDGGSGTITLTGNLLLNSGSFIATTGNLSMARDVVIAAPVVFSHNNGTVTLTGSGNITDVPTSLTLNILNLNRGSNTVTNTIATGDKIIVLGALSFTNGLSDGGAIEAQGDVTISNVGWDGGNTVLRFTAGNAQTLTILSGAGVRYNGNIEVNKTAGSVVTVVTAVAGEGLTLDATGQTLTVNSGTMDLGSSTLTTTGAATIAGGTLIQGTGVFTLGSLTVSSGTFTGGTVDATVSGAFTQTGGVFNAPLATFAVAGDFLRSGGTFSHNNGTVSMNGGNQAITGVTTFNNFSKQTSSSVTLAFPVGVLSEQTILGTLTLRGVAGALLSLRSSNPGTQFRINPQGTRDIVYVDVAYSFNTNATNIDCSVGCVDSENNTNWFIRDAFAIVPFIPIAPSPASGAPSSPTLPAPTPDIDLPPSDVTPPSSGEGVPVLFSGFTFPNALTFLIGNGQKIASIRADDRGVFSLSTDIAVPGSYTFYLYSEDKDRRRTPIVTVQKVVDGVSLLEQDIVLAPLISLGSSSVPKNTNILVQGKAVPGKTVQITLRGVGQEVTYKAITNSFGEYTLSIPTGTLLAGTYLVQLKIFLSPTVASASSDLQVLEIVAAPVIQKLPQKVVQKVIKGDFNNDGKVDSKDFSILAFWYKKKGFPVAIDLNGDKVIDIKDMSIFSTRLITKK